MKDRKILNVKAYEGWRAFTERIQPFVQQKMPFANKLPRAANTFPPVCFGVENPLAFDLIVETFLPVLLFPAFACHD